MYTVEQAREISLLSRSLGRQIGLLIDRRGRVDMVIVGKPDSIYIPELPHSRTGATRLRGLRLLHTHLTPVLLSEEDLMESTRRPGTVAGRTSHAPEGIEALHA